MLDESGDEARRDVENRPTPDPIRKANISPHARIQLTGAFEECAIIDRGRDALDDHRFVRFLDGYNALRIGGQICGMLARAEEKRSSSQTPQTGMQCGRPLARVVATK
jgi:hypothetical protein